MSNDMKVIERKRAPQVELKAVSDSGEFEGYGSVFGVLDSYGDIVTKGAFTASLDEHEREGKSPALLWNHNSDSPMGEWLEMREDDRGLFCKGRLWVDGPNPDPDALKAQRQMKARGRVGLSIGFSTRRQEIDNENGVRRLLDLELWEVSAVVFPANPMARVTDAKSFDTIRHFEQFLRDVGGMTAQQAKAVAASGWKSGDLRDGAPETAEPRDEAAIIAQIERNIRNMRGQTHA